MIKFFTRNFTRALSRTLIRTSLLILLLTGVHIENLTAASLNFQASAEYTVKGDPVVFTFSYDPQGDIPPKALKIEFSKEDGTIDHTLTFDDMDGSPILETYTMAYDRAGYFDVTASFRFTFIDDNGLEKHETKKLGPIRVNVANWKFTANNQLGCLKSTPAVSQISNTVYVGSENGRLYAVNTDTGDERWRFVAGGPITSSPCVDLSGNIFFGSVDGNIYSLAPDGHVKWWYSTGGPIFSSPALDSDLGRIYIGSNDGRLHALDADTGEMAWQFQTNGKIVSSPAVSHDQTVYIGTLGKTLYAVTPEGFELWRFEAKSEILNSPALDKDGTLFFGTASFRGAVDDNNGLYALSSTGDQKWFIRHASGFPGTPVIDSSGTICAGSYSNTLYGISRTGGRPVMYKRFSNDLLGSSAIGSNGYIYTGARDGMLYALNLFKGDEQSGRNVFWKYNLSLPITTSSPIIHDGYLYVGSCGYDGGALFSLACNLDGKKSDVTPSDKAPWPQFRNQSDNSGTTFFKPDTVFPEVVSTDPERNSLKLDTDRNSVSVTFSMPMEPSSVYVAHDPDVEDSGYFGFTVQPFESPAKDFDVSWNVDGTDQDYTVLTLTLPEAETFEPDVTYTATILSKAHARGDPGRSILYPLTWSFGKFEEEKVSYSYSPGGCFISTLLEKDDETR